MMKVKTKKTKKRKKRKKRSGWSESTTDEEEQGKRSASVLAGLFAYLISLIHAHMHMTFLFLLKLCSESNN